MIRKIKKRKVGSPKLSKRHLSIFDSRDRKLDPKFTFTPRVHAVFRIAHETTKNVCNAIGTDDLLLAIAMEPSGIGCAILGTLKIDAEKIRAVQKQLLGNSPQVKTPKGVLHGRISKATFYRVAAKKRRKR